MAGNIVLLKKLIKLLVEVHGSEAVYAEALLQRQFVMIDRMVRYMGPGSDRINRIKVVRAMGIVLGLKEAKNWVEEHYADEGAGPPL